MKAIVPLFALAALAACASPPPPVVQQPAPVRPAPKPRPAPAPPPAASDWRDAPQTPGTWRWQLRDGSSLAQFVGPDGQAIAAMQCLRGERVVTLGRSAAGSPPVLVTVRTTGAPARAFTSQETPAPGGWIGIRIASSDPLLDAIAFSRGRFVLEAAGKPALYLPAWPELSRVVEDCR